MLTGFRLHLCPHFNWNGVPCGLAGLHDNWLNVEQVTFFTQKGCPAYDAAAGKSQLTIAKPLSPPPAGFHYFGWGCMQDNILHAPWKSYSYVCAPQQAAAVRRSLKNRQVEAPHVAANDVFGRRSLKGRQSEVPSIAAGQLFGRDLTVRSLDVK
jgi:hypothetical protein